LLPQLQVIVQVLFVRVVRLCLDDFFDLFAGRVISILAPLVMASLSFTLTLFKSNRSSIRNLPSVPFPPLGADTDEAGHTFQSEVGHCFRFEAGRGSDLMSATWGLLPRIEVMMFRPDGLVKRTRIWTSAQ
jgi:hypothetical protein